MNVWQVGDVRITSVAEVDDVAIPGEAVIPSASAEALQRHPWLVPHSATEDGDAWRIEV